MPRGRKPGTKITYTPQETGRYRSQWLRFEKGVRLDHQKVGENEWQVESHRAAAGFWTVKYGNGGDGGDGLTYPGFAFPAYPPPIGDPVVGTTSIIRLGRRLTVQRAIYSQLVSLDDIPSAPSVDELSPYFTGLIQLVSDSEGGTENLLHYDSYAAERFPYTYGSLPSNLIYDTPLGVFLIPYSENYGIWGYYFLTTQYVFLDGGSDLDPYPFPGSSGPAIDPGPFPGLGGAPGLKKWMCDCPDFSLKEPATGRFASEQGARDWSSSNAGSGRVGNEQQFCKHIHSVRASLNLPANVSAEDWKVMENWKEYVDQALRNRAQHRKRKRRRGKGGSDAAYKRYQRWLDRTARRGGLSREERKQRDARRKQERKAVDQAFKQRQDAKVRRQAEKRAIDQRANNYRDRYVRGESIDSIIQDAKRTNNQKAFDQFYKGVS